MDLPPRLYLLLGLVLCLLCTLVESGCQNIAVTLNNRVRFPDYSFSATSHFDNRYTAKNARFASSKAWGPSTNSDANDYLQIDLGRLYKICAVATRSAIAVSEWVTRYKLHFSQDNANWDIYKENNVVKLFTGNTDTSSAVKNNVLVKARFVRLQPTASSGYKSVRVEIYGTPEDCSQPFEIGNRGIEDAQMTSSSRLDNSHTASHGRLYGDNSWCSSTSSNSQHLQVDLGRLRTVTGIATQGDKTVDKWVKSFTIRYSRDGSAWNDYTDELASRIVLLGNTNKDEVRVNFLKNRISARYFRIVAQTWSTAICMRIELYGCPERLCDNTPLGLESGTIINSKMSASSQYNTSYPASNARLNYTGGPSWCASTSDSDPYLQIDLGLTYVICAVATQGNFYEKQWTKSYTLQGSVDGTSFNDYLEDNIKRIFEGNFDQNTVVKLSLNKGFVARYVRFLPVSISHGAHCIRAEIYGMTTSACQRSAVGIRASSKVPDYRMTATSFYSATYSIHYARLYSSGSWATKRNDENDYVQIDLGAIHVLCALATQGAASPNEWTKTYNVSLSMDGVTWMIYEENDAQKVFTGNTDKNTAVRQTMAAPTAAKYIRFYPKLYNSHKQLRVEVYGLRKECRSPLGVETFMGIDPVAQLSSSSQSDAAHSAAKGRLYGTSAWCTTNTVNQYIQVDLLVAMSVTGVVTQGDADASTSKWVQTYDVQFGYETSKLFLVQGIQGNTNSSSTATHWFSKPMGARYVRILPRTWSTGICLRMDVYGCKQVAPPDIETVEAVTNLTASIGSPGQISCSVYALSHIRVTWRQGQTDMTSSSQISYQNGFANSVLRVNFANANDYGECSRQDPTSRSAACSRIYNCEAYYDNVMNGPAYTMDGKIFVELDAPSAPTSFTIGSVLDNSAYLTWSVTPPNVRQATVGLYKIKYNVEGEQRVFQDTTSGNSLSHTIGGLLSNTSYVVKLSAVSVVGDGASLTQRFRTLPTILCKNRAIGMELGLIPDPYITASSQMNSLALPSNARLNKLTGSSWCASTSDSNPYLQIDLGSSHLICAVATQGNIMVDQWVTSYNLLFSDDGINWRYQQERRKVFRGNTDRNTVMKRDLVSRPSGRFIRFIPRGYYGRSCLRVELYGKPAQKECADISVGLASVNTIVNHRFTASTSYGSDNQYKPYNARLGSSAGWAASGNSNPSDYLQIDLGAVYRICAVATFGSAKSNEYVSRYKLFLSMDNAMWAVYKVNGNEKVFPGNVDRNVLVKNQLTEAVSARFIRFNPTSYTGHKTMRVEVYGVPQDCKEPLGIENLGIEDAQMTSSSHLDNTHDSSHGRLYGDNSWCSSTASSSEYLQVDVGSIKTVTGIATQGDSAIDKWIKTFAVSYSMNDIDWTVYTAGKNIRKVLTGNNDKSTVAVNWLPYPFNARYVRVVPLTWNAGPCLRFDLYGCPVSCANLAIGLQQSLIPDSQISASSQHNASTAAKNARLHYTSGSSWCASTSDSNPYLQIDLGSPHVVCAVATQGDHFTDNSVETYQIQGSSDGVTFTDYNEIGAVKTFAGNFDRNPVIKQIMKNLFIARYVRFLPKSYNVLPCMRVEVYGSRTAGCVTQPVGLRVGSSIRDHRLSASSFYSDDYPISSARLYAPRAWATKSTSNSNDYVQIDLGSMYAVCAVATQGSPTMNEWVTSYKMSTSLDGTNWNDYSESGTIRTFTGNTDKNTVMKRNLANIVAARFVRIYPVAYNNHKDLRFELYGMKHPWAVPLGLETGSIADNQLTATSFYNSSQVAAHARLYGVSSWCKSTSSSGQAYLQVDLRAVMQISGIATQGNAENAWVTLYDLRFSYSTSDWQDVSGIQGNVDKNGLVVHMFNQPFSARYLRLRPTTSQGVSCVRMEVYGNDLVARPEILGFTGNEFISANKGSWAKYNCRVKALEFVTILWKHGKTILSSSSTYAGGITLSTLTLNYTNGDDFASTCRKVNLSSQASNCNSTVTCQAFYDYLLTDGSAKRVGTVRTTIKVPLAPVNVTFLKIRHHSTQVHWTPGDVTIDRASVRYFYIQYYPVSDVSRILNMTLRSTKRMVHVGGLDGNTSYVVQIRAVSIAGEGLWATESFSTNSQVSCSKKTLGMEDESIPDVYITSSSKRDNSTKASFGRLNHLSSWCASASDSSPYLQVDLGMLYVICATATQGNPVNDEWVTSYEMHYTRDGINWRPVLEKTDIKIFSGNQDRSSVVIQEVPGQTVARSVRFLPKSLNGSACLRTELFGEPYYAGCAVVPIGVQSPNTIPGHRFTASSYFSIDHQPNKARLGGDSSWRPRTDTNPDDYLQIDLGTIYTICVIETDGQSPTDRVLSYVVYYSLDNQDWDVLVDPRGMIKVFNDSKTKLDNKISARFVRFFPREYSGHKSLRVQLYGVAEVCKESLGAENKGIENNQMTSSSHHDNAHTVSSGRLYGNSSWCSSTSSLFEYIEIDLGKVKTVRGIATQGDHVTDKWVKTYTVRYSMDGKGYVGYTGETSTTKVFPGNTDRNGVVVNWLRYPINARYIRISPQDWNGAICLRVDLYGCQATCSNTPLGLESGTILDTQMSASSQYNTSYPASNARLHYTGGPSWCASTSDPDPYLQIDLGSPHVICAVGTQGDHHRDQWVEKYTVKGSLDGITWANEMDFIANSDGNTQVKHDITVAMTARFVKFLPTRSYGNACMRVELYGTTSGGCSKESIGVRLGGTIKDHRITSSSNNSPESSPYMARLHGPRGWSPRTTTNDSDFLQIDLGSVYLLCGVATQGSGERSQWTSSYTIATSFDGSTWVSMKENHTDKVFPGNTESSTVVKNTLNQVTVAKFVRFYPRTYHVYKQLRVEMYGIQHGCRQGLGMENGLIQDSHLSAWSFSNKNLSNATTARLYGHSAWDGGKPVDFYLQVDLVDARMITGIATQGSPVHHGWVDAYDVKFGFSTSFWYQMKNFKGNKDGHGVRVNWLTKPLGAVFLRIIPVHWKSTPYFRVDLYGCQRVASPRIVALSKNANLTAINGSAVTLTCSAYGEPFTSIRWLNVTNDVTWSSNTPSHNEGRVDGNITVPYTSAEMIYSTYECQRVHINRTIRCWTSYTCSVYYSHYTNEGFDERSIRVFVNLILPDAPSKPSTSKMNSTSVTITWYRPDPGDGSILSYKIKYGKYGENITGIVNSTSTGNSTQSIRLTGLEPYSRYIVTVIPVGSIGDGMESPSTVFVTYLRSSIYVPSSQYIFQAGQINVTLQCSAQGYPLPNITWTKDGFPVSSNQYIDNKLSKTNISSQLILGNQSGVTFQEAGNYTCHVVNHVDGLGPISSVIEVILKPEVKVIPPQIFSVESTTVTFQCVVSGVPLPVISWNFNGEQLPNNSQVMNKSLIIKDIINTADNEGTYTCVATSRAGIAESSANLTVWVLPRILQPLKNITLMVGSTLNITCAVSGEPVPDVTWTKDNMTNVTGAEYSERRTRLVIRSVTVRDEGVYTCNASSKAGWTVSPVIVTIRAAEEVFLSQPYTRSYTKNQTNITAACYGRGYPRPTITWLRDNQTISRVESMTSNDTARVVQVIQDKITEPLDNVTSRMYLRTAGVMYRDAGNYTCRVSNGVGATPAEKTLEILFVPEFTILPQDQMVLVGSHVLFTCAASGVPTPHISWLFNDKPTKHNVTNGNLLFTAVHNNRLYEGNYTCVARSRAGENRRTVSLYVDELPKVSRIEGPSQVELTTNLTLTCFITGDPIPSVYWTRDGSPGIPDAVFTNMNRTLSIVSAQLTVEGVYRCIAWNRAGNDSMDFNVSALAYPMVYVAPPYIRPYRLDQRNISIECRGSGYPTPTVRWKKGDDVIPLVDFRSDNDTVVQVSGGNISDPLHNITSVLYLRTRGIKYSDAGNYTCEVVHSASPNPAHRTVEILFKPEFVFTSNDKIVPAGSDVTFSCLASGVPEPSIGWMFNNGNLSVPHFMTGTNITLKDIKNSDLYEGNYTCIATSRAGTDRHTARLEVDVPSIVLNITGNTSIMINTVINLTCTVDGDPFPNVFWVKDGSRNISEASYYHDNRSLVIGHAQIKDEGKYQCLAENRAGKDNKTVEISILASPSIYTSHTSPTVFKRGAVNQSIDCYGNGYPRPSISWHRSNIIVPVVVEMTSNDTNRVVQVVKSDISFPLQNITSRLYLRTSGLTYAEAGNYSCQVSNKVSTAQRVVEVLFFPIIDVTPSDQIALEGANVTFTCEASGVPRPSVTWLFNGQDIPWNHTVVNGSLFLWNVRNKHHEGNYTCLATSRSGRTNHTAQLVIDVPPRILEVSGNRTYLINTKILLTCNVTGDPVPSVSWMRPGAKPISFNRTLVIDKADLDDEGEYQCVAGNRAGNTSYQVFITIQALVSLYVSPPIRRSYLHGDQNVTIECQANGYPKPSISWWSNGRPVLAVDDVYPNHTSKVVQVTWDNISEKLQNVTSRLFVRVDGITFSDAGNYTCNASNGVGDGPRLKSVEILFRPEIYQAPQIKTVLVDTNVTFFCNATGIPEPTLTWTFSKGSVRSTDVTANSLVLPYVQNSDSYEGMYTCNASNIVGTASASATLTIHTVPEITIRLPATMIIERGTTANLTCQSRGDPEPKYRWYKSDQPITQGYRFVNGNKTLLLSNVTVKDEGRYTCEAYNIEGNDSTSTNITVHAVPVLLQALPMVSGIIVNKTLQLSCRAESIPPPNVTWLLNGSLVTNDNQSHFVIQTSGIFVKTSTFTIKNVQYADRGTYQCMFSNYRGVVNTTSTLEVYVPPRIVTLLTNGTYPKGSTMTLTCQVTGKPYPSVYWFKSGSRDIPRAHLSNRNTTLVINDLRFEDRGEYQCVAVNKGGNDSSTTTIVITVPTTVEIASPFTRVYRRGMTDINIKCYAIGFPKPTLEWHRYGARVPVVSNIAEVYKYDVVQIIRDDVSGVQNLQKMYSVLYLRPSGISYDEAGNYTCVANRSIDGLSAQKTIEVLFVPEFDVTPQTQIVTVGSNVTFSCNASGVPPPVISWFFNGKPIIASSIRNLRRDILRIFSVQNTDAYEGQYTCSATSRAGTANYTATLAVDVEPVVIGLIGNTTVISGSKINLTCVVQGDPMPRVLWMKDGSMIPLRGNVSYNSLIIEKVVFEDRGVYQCIAVNRAGSDSRQVRMAVLVPPMVYVQPPLPRVYKQKQPNVYIDCYGNGYPQPSVSWSINNTVIPIIPYMTSNYYTSTVQLVNQNISHPMDNVTSRLYLRKEGLTLKEAGNYSCSAMNGIDSPSVRTVEVLFFPEFELTPVNKVVLEGSSVLFRCAVSGVPRPSVTWYFSGGSLPNLHTVQGSNLLIRDVKNNPSYEGNYTCVGQSRAGSTNYTAELVVQVSPVMVISLNNTLVVERGDWVTLFCKAAGDPEPAYLWIKDGVTLTGNTQMRFHNNSQLLVLTNVTTRDNGVYTCFAYNVEGNASTSTNLTVHATISIIQGLPLRTDILEGKALSLTCKADAIPLPSVTWYRNRQEIQDGADGRWKIQSNSFDSTLTSTMSLQNVSYDDRGEFSCAFSNYRGNAKSTGRVVVQVPPAILLPPSSVSRLLNKNVTFSCSVRGYPEPTITWSKDGVSLSQSDHISISLISKNASIELTSYLNIISTARQDTGVYVCNASNIVGTATRPARLVILEIPDRPGLLVASLTSTTALLQWNIKFNGNSPIRYYTISYNSSEGALSINITADQPREHKFKGLLPATQYIFLVTASNDVGTSLGTESLRTTLESVPWQPRNVYAQSLSSTSVFVNWTVPARTNGNLTRYMVFIRAVNQNIAKEMNVTVRPSIYNTTIDGLVPYTYYEGEVRAYTKIGGGNRSLTFDAVLTFEDVPSAPRRLQGTQYTSTSITLLWKRPAIMNGILRAYQIAIREQLDNDTIILNVTQDISEDTVTYTVTGLRPHTIYNITVSAVTISSGNASNTIAYSTDEDKPGEPRDVNSTFDDEVYEVTWFPPLTPNGVITNYKVLFQLDRTVSVDSDAKDEAFIVDGGQTQLKVKLTDLNGDKTYNIRVQAKTSKGYGRISTSYFTIKTPITNPPEPETPSKTPDVTISTAIINVPKFSDINGQIKFYGVINVVIPKGTQGQLKDPASYKEEDLVSYCVAHQSKTPAAYLAFKFDASEYEKYKVFVLGKGQGTKCSMRVARASDTPNYYNGPLMPNTKYKSFIRGYTKDTFAQSGYFGFTTQPKSSGSGDGGGGGGGAGAAIGVVVVIILVVVIAGGLYFYRRKKRNAAPPEEEERELNELGREPDEPLYDNFDENAPQQRLPIPVEDLKSYYLQMHADSDHLFDEEFKSIQSPMGVTTTKCDLPINKPKNRYGNIKAYDHSRVVLSTTDNEPGADYINANYIDGYSEKKQYIATIGPKESTCDDFWRMVWEQKSSIIVMLTKPEENGKVKCQKYWPDESSTFGRITVQLEEKEELADFEISTFTLQMLSQPQIQPRKVIHFFFTSWPDHDVPDYATGLLEFWKRVKKYQSGCGEKGPMIVHCSAGVGRTGTFIVIDAMMEQNKAEGELDVLAYVTKIRSQRNFMVQRSSQYAFIHYALLEAITFGHTEIEVQDLRTILGRLEQRRKQTELTGLEKQFELLNGVVPDDTYDFVTAVQPHNAKKNRFSNVLPFDRTRVILSDSPGKEDATYINASYLEGHQEKIGYIATQTPLVDTVDDFWRMVWETEVYSIVMLCTLEEPTKVPYVKYWPDKDSVTYGTLLVETRSQQAEKDLIIREFNITNTQTGEVRKILQFNYLDWPEQSQPTNLLSLIDLIGVIQKARRQHAHRPIVVHCSNGIGRTGAFCTLFTSLERVKLEGWLDVFITARMLRTQRPGMVETLDQYRMCYQAILAYLDSFEESQYQNFM